MDLKVHEIKSDEELEELKRSRDILCKLQMNVDSLKLAMSMIDNLEADVIRDAIDLIYEASSLIDMIRFRYRVPNDLNKSIALYEAMKKIETFNPHARGDGKNYGRD